MYRLMQSVKHTLEHPTLGVMSSYRQSLLGRYGQARTALEACDKENAAGRSRCYVLNERGQENYRGAWID
jgi:hypothetical protein